MIPLQSHPLLILRVALHLQLAAESGNEGTMRVLRKVVEVDDEATGTVRVKRNVEKLDEMELDTRSTRTVQVRKAAPAVRFQSS